MNKKMIVSVLLVTLVLSGLFARGQMGSGAQCTAEEAESARAGVIDTLAAAPKTTLTGEIYNNNRIYPELHSAGLVYQLVTFPMHFAFQNDIAEGSTVTVETTPVTQELLESHGPMGMQGGRMHGRMSGNEANEAPIIPENLLLVTKWTVAGETYDLAEALATGEEPEYSGKGRRGGMLRGRGMSFQR